MTFSDIFVLIFLLVFNETIHNNAFNLITVCLEEKSVSLFILLKKKNSHNLKSRVTTCTEYTVYRD